MFPCTKCGLCCKNVGRNSLYKDLDRGDGICKNLTNTMSCSVYEDRPLLCRIDDAFDKIFAVHLSRKKYYELNVQVCYKLQVSAGTPVAERIGTR